MNKSRILGWSLLALISYCTLGAVVYFASLLALQKGTLLDLPWFVSTQKALYRGGMVTANSWLSMPGCITPDADLIFTPTNGACQFDDIEFKSTLHFTDEGRNTGPKPPGTGIAVIGDSHAMGWGVNDQDTFAARLQNKTRRPVYNLGVAGYGTERELIRLEKSGVLDKVDTVIIQYCNNDKSENLQFGTASHQALLKKIFDPAKPVAPPSKLGFIARGYWLTLAAPFRTLGDLLRRNKDFRPHYDAFLPLLEKHRQALENKRVIVFYSNPYGQKYRNFPSGPDAHLPNVDFVDLDLSPSNYRNLDNHLTAAGHQTVAERLVKYLPPPP